ncbi:MAG: aromatic ring-hydroxylating dioxygenase subunit alpha [bacterium]|nr:aromatic ring-hydroxylating dioxygenase subunit alpha [Gammaproteobacteria bacterium]
MAILKTDTEVIQQIFEHIDQGTTDRGDETWQEPTINYTSEDRFNEEIELLRHLPIVFAPSVALKDKGCYIARTVAGVPIIVVRDKDDGLKAFRNACRHRGMALAEGQGKISVFRCGYHGWAYGLDGALQHVPHDSGFPDLDFSCNGLVRLHSVSETDGLIYICIDEPIDQGALAEMPQVLPDGYEVFDTGEYEQAFNWKLNIEATLEGYHIKPTHEKTFYPYGYDNLNVVETFGANSRVTFPFRRIESLRDVPESDRDISGKVTYVYNVFPNCTVAILSNHVSVSISEPISPSVTHYHTFRLGKLDGNETEEDIERMQRDARFVSDTGLEEDNAVVAKIQHGLKSGANSHFNYGQFEKAIVHLHKNLKRLVEAR